MEDRAHATSSEEEIKDAFETAYAILRYRIVQFLALPLDELKHDRECLKAELDRIGTSLP